MSSSLKRVINKTMKRKRGGTMYGMLSKVGSKVGSTVSIMTPKLSYGSPKQSTQEQEKTIAATNTQCAQINARASKRLDELGITSYSHKESKTVTELNPYDSSNKTIEKYTGALTVAAAAGALIPFAGQFFTLARVALLGVNKYQKDKELSYLSSDCLSYISNITKDIADMNAFYMNKTVREKKIQKNATLYAILQKNLFKFLYFLIDNINFTDNNLGPVQYSFWHSFLKQIDFSESSYSEELSPNKYRYSCAECIPNELREKLRDPNIDYKKVINLDMNKDSMFTRASKTLTLDRRKSTDLLSVFCDEDMVLKCRNNNDIIMRLIEFNMYKLINSTYKNRKASYKKFNLNSEMEDALFKFIFTLSVADTKDTDAKEKEKEEEDEVKAKVLNDVPDDNKNDANVYLSFLFELKRIINELKYSVPISSPSRFGYDTLVSGANYTGVSKIGAIASSYVGTALSRYNEMLREYIIMTGNFGTITSRYAIDYNSLSQEEKVAVEKDVKEKIGSIGDAIRHIMESSNAVSQEATIQAAYLFDVPVEISGSGSGSGLGLGLGSGADDILSGMMGSGMQRQSKKIKNKRNKSKRNMNHP